MKFNILTKATTGLLTFVMMSAAEAGIPLWTFTPLTSTTFEVPDTGTDNAQYTVRNQSSKAKRLVIKPTPGVQQTAPCNLNPKGQAGDTCVLSLLITGSALPPAGITGGPNLCQANPDNSPNPNQCYQPSSADTLRITKDGAVSPGATTLSTSIPSPSILALSVNNLPTKPALTGNPRQITITNTGPNEATGLNITYPAWPGGTPATTTSSTCGSSLAAGSSCTITVTPGATATSDGTNPCSSGTAPVPGVVQVSADNATTVSSNVVVLSYGCIYQGGYIYAVDDTTADTGSIGGKVAGINNVSFSNQWTSTYLDISGAQSPTNGTQNTTDIVASTPCTDSPTNCAAYQCRINFTGGGNTDWYLPAICEMGFDNFGDANSGCGTQSSPTLQNMQSNLVDNGNVGSLSSFYWSSTMPLLLTDNAWFQFFATGDVSNQGNDDKTVTLGVRCSRALTI